jgi:ABC-type uncharacterized transport system YnjBCD ATPase subunit
MSKPQITVTISGPAGAGKSTLAEHIASDLAIRYGVKVQLIDDGWNQLLPTSARHLPGHFDADVAILVEQK